MLEKEKAAIHKYLTDNEITTVLDEDDLVHHAYMLTQYEKYGEVNLNSLYDYLITEVMEEPEISEVNDYLMENHYEDYYFTYDEIDEQLFGLRPTEIISMVGNDFDATAPYFNIGIYGLESLTEAKIMKVHGKDTKNFLLETGRISGEAADIMDDSEEIIKIANYLVREGW